MNDKAGERQPDPTPAVADSEVAGKLDDGLVRGTQEIFDRVLARPELPELADKAYEVLLENYLAIRPTGSGVDRAFALESVEKLAEIAGMSPDRVNELFYATMKKHRKGEPAGQSDEHLV